MRDESKLILASASKARRYLLAQAGIDADVQPASLDENAIIAEERAKSGPHDLALQLAGRKALAVAAKNPGRLVIGADQILSCEGKMHVKADSVAEARRTLQELRGKVHHLVSAVCVARDGEILWQHAETADMAMKNFDDAFLDEYAAAAGDALTQSVGAYELEGKGAWLFEKIEGDYFTILGLPLLALLQFLETQGYGP